MLANDQNISYDNKIIRTDKETVFASAPFYSDDRCKKRILLLVSERIKANLDIICHTTISFVIPMNVSCNI